MRMLLLASTLAFVAGGARADVVSDALAGFVKCAEIVDPVKRLECFDAATARGKAALAPQPAQPAKDKSLLDWFGLSKPSQATKPEDFGKPAPEPAAKEITEISDTVLEFAKTARGKAIFILQNGQVWRQIDSDASEVLPPAPGTTMKVTIEIGVFGSFNLTVEGRRGLIKVNRLK